MKSIINQIFSGELGSGEKIGVSKEYKRLNRQLEKLINKIKLYLPEDCAEKILWDLDFLQRAVEAEACAYNFEQGFKLGLQLGAEAFLNKFNRFFRNFKVVGAEV